MSFDSRTRKIADLLRVEDEFAEGLQVRFKSWFRYLDFTLGFPRSSSLCFLFLVVSKRTFCNHVKKAPLVEWIRLTYRSTCICLEKGCQKGARCGVPWALPDFADLIDLRSSQMVAVLDLNCFLNSEIAVAAANGP